MDENKQNKLLIRLSMGTSLFSIITVILILLEIKKIIPSGISNISLCLAFGLMGANSIVKFKLTGQKKFMIIGGLLILIGIINLIFGLGLLVK